MTNQELQDAHEFAQYLVYTLGHDMKDDMPETYKDVRHAGVTIEKLILSYKDLKLNYLTTSA